MNAVQSATESPVGISKPQFDQLLKILEIVEGRTRRVRALLNDAKGRRVGEMTIRNGCVEPGVIVRGSVFVDKKLAHDAGWLANVVSKVGARKLTSSEASRRLIRSTKSREVAEHELQSLTARALMELALIGVHSGLEVEFTRSGPKRGPVYSFQSIELLASACAEFSPEPIAFDAPEALGQFADAVWHFRVASIMPGYDVVPLPPTQGVATVQDTLEMARIVVGLMETASKLRFDSAHGEPFSAHYLSPQFGIAWIATESEIAVARLHGPRSVMALGPSRDLSKNSA